jgi:hypothetical protein
VSTVEITLQSVIWDILQQMPEARELFNAHGCDMDAECTDEALENTLDEAVGVCHLEDVDGLILELQALADILQPQA